MRGDESAGVKVVQLWAAQHPERLVSPQVEMALIPSAGLGLLDRISAFEFAILVDAVLGGPGVSPGSLLYLTPDDLTGFTGPGVSDHSWALADAFQMAAVMGDKDLPGKLTILGIGGSQAEIGATLSPVVADIVPEAAASLDRLVAEYLG